MHFYQFNIADYRKDTGHLTPIEHYIYRELLDMCYLNEMPINGGRSSIRRRLKLVETDDLLIQGILDEFFIKTDDGYINNRVNLELSRIYEKSDKARESVKKRWDKAKLYERNTNVYERNTNDILPNNLIPNDLRPNKNILSEKSDEITFEDFYKAYPKKVKRKEALKAWKGLNGMDKQVIMDDIEKRKAIEWDLGDKRFIPAPSAYLNKERWTDEIIERKSSQRKPIDPKTLPGWIPRS